MVIKKEKTFDFSQASFEASEYTAESFEEFTAVVTGMFDIEGLEVVDFEKVLAYLIVQIIVFNLYLSCFGCLSLRNLAQSVHC